MDDFILLFYGRYAHTYHILKYPTEMGTIKNQEFKSML